VIERASTTKSRSSQRQGPESADCSRFNATSTTRPPAPREVSRHATSTRPPAPREVGRHERLGRAADQRRGLAPGADRRIAEHRGSRCGARPLTTQWTVDSCDKLRRQTWIRFLTVRSQCRAISPASPAMAGLSRHAGRDPPCAELETVAARVVARKLQTLRAGESPLPRKARLGRRRPADLLPEIAGVASLRHSL
jgi:hypothetical protein